MRKLLNCCGDDDKTVDRNRPNLTKLTKINATEHSSTSPSSEDKTAEQKSVSDEEARTVSQFQLFRYANQFEICLMTIGGICAIGGGCLVPATVFIFGEMVRDIVDEELRISIAADGNATASSTTSIVSAVKRFAIGNSVIGVGMLFLVYMSVMLFNYTSQRQAFRIRQMYLKSVLRQDIGWYDLKIRSGNVATELTEDVIKFEEGIGEKFAIFVDHVAVFLFSIVFALYYGWKLALVCLASFPITGIVLAAVARITSGLSRRELDAFGAASSVAQEVLSAIKTVVAYNGQSCELERYKRNLDASYKINARIGLASGCGFGFLWLSTYACYALSQWYGVALVMDQRHLPVGEREYDTAVMVSVFFCTVVGAMNIGVVSPYVELFSVSKAAAAKIFSVIERKSTIDSLDSKGVALTNFRGSIEFKNVQFQYPSRPDVPVLRKLNFSIKDGETVALVGGSGCGKSTCIQLLQRFYDPNDGQILLDGRDLRDLNVAWLRSIIGIVGQEPVLFDTTIAENIRYGNLDATMEMIVEAAKQSNAHDFIMKLPSKYDTHVGEMGAQLSGGQKQRIAIARALIRDPKILLLDEATSALDNRSESTVQAALDRANIGRTTVIVAHRLTTIRGADKILVLSDGQVVEEGNHETLMRLEGHYHSLVTGQVSEFRESRLPRTIADDRTERFDEDPVRVTIKSEVRDDKKSDGIMVQAGTWKVLKLNTPEWKLILIASVASVVVGSSTVLFAVLFGDVIDMLSDPDVEAVRGRSTMYILYFICAGVIIGTATCVQLFLLTVASERLTTRLRGFAFGAMLKQEMAWFDDPSNGAGALCAKLSTEAAAVKGATGQRIGTIVQSIGTLLLAIGLSIYYDWRLGLLGMTFIPLIVVITLLHGRMYKKETLNYHKNLEESTKIAIEAVSNIRTVIGLGREEIFYNGYVKAVTPSFEEAKRNIHYRGLIFALFKSITCFAYAAVLYYGGVLVQDHDMEFSGVFKVSQALITGTVVFGQAYAFSPNLQKGIMAAASIIGLIERASNVRDPTHPQENNPEDEGDVKFDNVSFEYSTRPGVVVLNSLNLEIEPGKTVALVGSSGCGKSTVIKMLERFYDPDSGIVNINGKNVASMTQSSLRMSLGLVEQEPTVFARTIRENIAYGDNSRDVSMDEIIMAAKSANIHDFVALLPLGYDTNLGDKGSMLSGGQKQRVAIARALVRKPQILLLDEATSALDSESEKIVQAALDDAKTGRTCILIAHRLSTVENADKICVFQGGSVVESGTHEELVRNCGLYYEMLCLQTRGE